MSNGLASVFGICGRHLGVHCFRDGLPRPITSRGNAIPCVIGHCHQEEALRLSDRDKRAAYLSSVKLLAVSCHTVIGCSFGRNCQSVGPQIWQQECLLLPCSPVSTPPAGHSNPASRRARLASKTVGSPTNTLRPASGPRLRRGLIRENLEYTRAVV